MKRGFNYCQLEIEDRDACEIKCDHCKEYYAPLEKEAVMKMIETQASIVDKKFNEFYQHMIGTACAVFGITESMLGDRENPGGKLKAESPEDSLRYINHTKSFRDTTAFMYLGRVQGIYKSKAMVRRLQLKGSKW